MSVRRRRFLAMAGTAAGTVTVTTPAAAAKATVGMKTEDQERFFDPIGLHVDPGTTVTFENVSGFHNSEAYTDRIPNGAEAWSTTLGETQELTFEETGTYDYYCAPHKQLGMIGRIVVGEPGGPAEGSMPPDGDVPDSSTIVNQGTIGYTDFGIGGSGDTTQNRLYGTGLLGGMAVLAGVVYWISNSEGESYRVGSSEWKDKEGIK